MSHVIIGIIGVILAIGTAMSGIVYFGPTVIGAANLTTANAQIHSMSKIIVAAARYTDETGDPNGGLVDQVSMTAASPLVTAGYLKTVPADAAGRGATFVPFRNWGPRYLMIGNQTRAVCLAFAQKFDSSFKVVPTSVDITKVGGCHGSGTEGTYLLSMRMQ